MRAGGSFAPASGAGRVARVSVPTFKIEFRLRPIEQITPWGAPPNLMLGWFGLSDGDYCIETSAGRLLTYEDGSWCAYQVARLFEDLNSTLPHVLEPVPEDVSARFFAWRANPAAEAVPADSALAEAWLGAQAWWGSRQLDFSHLTAAPGLHMWRSGSMVNMRWRAALTNTAMAVTHADLALPVDVFESRIASFFEDFLTQMGQRVDLIARQGWCGQACDVDVDGLVSEQRQREYAAARPFGTPTTDWNSVRVSLARVGG